MSVVAEPFQDVFHGFPGDEIRVIQGVGCVDAAALKAGTHEKGRLVVVMVHADAEFPLPAFGTVFLKGHVTLHTYADSNPGIKMPGDMIPYEWQSDTSTDLILCPYFLPKFLIVFGNFECNLMIIKILSDIPKQLKGKNQMMAGKF